jgi:hypothetical protein
MEATMNEQLEKIIKAPLPTTTRNIRDLDRKEQAKIVRQLFKSLGFTGVSVTTPTYSMASSINISLPRQPWEGEHEPEHNRLQAIEYSKPSYNGMVQVCPWCKESWLADKQIRAIILAAFPDMDNRSDTQSDYSDFAFTINS